MVTLRHMAGLAGGSGGPGLENAALLQVISHSVFRGRIHLPLRMVESHVTGLAGLRRFCLRNRERVPSVAGVTGRGAENTSFLLQLHDLVNRLLADLVASAAAFLPFDHRHWLPMNRRHGHHGCPRFGVLPTRVLVHLRLVALRTSFWSWNLDFRHVTRRSVLVAMADRAWVY
jgi:hypothetical protein